MQIRMPVERLYELIEKYLQNELQPEELIELQSLLQQDSQRGNVESLIHRQLAEKKLAFDGIGEERLSAMQQRIKLAMGIKSTDTKEGSDQNIGTPGKVIRIRRRSRWIWVAAASVLLATATLYLWNSNPQDKAERSLAAIGPGKKGATLTLANGRKILLDSARQGLIAKQSGINVTLKDNRLAYEQETGSKNPAAAPEMNMLSVPKGRTFSLTLPDGTRVWLNSVSSIRYPTSFKSTERVVEITGEAYFEVAENSKMPFRVITDSTSVTVLGTSFNVHAYRDEEAMQTTLVTGKIMVKNEKGAVTLDPGQQSSISYTDRQIHSGEGDIEKAIAWKTGFFDFDQLNLQQIMREISRWYDIDIIFENKPSDLRLGGRISKDLPLAQVLRSLPTDDVSFNMENGRLVIRTSTNRQ